MKPAPVAALLLASGMLVAEDQPGPGTTYIPGPLTVTPFAPPPPPVAKPEPNIRIDASVAIGRKDGTVLTLQRGEASTRPDLPPPPPPPPASEPREPTPEEVARRLHYLRHNFNLGATIYDHTTSVVNWTDPVSRMPYTAVCGFDLGLLAGVGRFIHDGENYQLMLFHSHIDTTLPRRLPNRRPPDLPEVPAGEISITRGEASDSAATAPVFLLGRLIAAEKERLLAYQDARAAYFKAHREWYAAHPPVPQDTKITLRPHRGSRYLTNPSPKSEQP
jgi:hypothetical protein